MSGRLSYLAQKIMPIKSDSLVRNIVSKIDTSKKRVAELQEWLISKAKLPLELKELRHKISQIEIAFENKNLAHMLKFNHDYRLIKIKIKSLEHEIQIHKNADDEQIKTKINKLLKNIDSYEIELVETRELVKSERLFAETKRMIDEQNKQALAKKQADAAKQKSHPKSKKDKADAPEKKLARIRTVNTVGWQSVVSTKINILKKKLAETKAVNISGFQSTISANPTKISEPEILLLPDWKDVIFADYYVLVRHNNRLYKKYVSKARKIYNDIKHYYSFKQVPYLQVVICGQAILEIKNEEVLFFHVELFSESGSVFGDAHVGAGKITKWSKYTKRYYKNHLPFLLQTYCLQKLCEVCDPNLPIIPVAEVVINSKGAKSLHNSFLFPVKTRSGIKMVWESVEVSKASYVFHVKTDYWQCAQNVYDYVCGETINKRSELVADSSLQSQLNMKQRILHTDLYTWGLSIKNL